MPSKSLTKEEFIEKARSVHGDKYDYSKTVYTRSTIKVCIICPEHGEFWQAPSSHLQGHGCPKCSADKLSELKAKTTEWFIDRAKSVHGDKYDYSLVKYTNNSTKIPIICHKKDKNGIEHGVFYQKAGNHMSGQGCPKCKAEGTIERCTISQEEIIKRFKEVHGDKYDYSKVVYKGILDEVCIICPEHGEFWQKPVVHYNNKCGCPVCGRKKSNEAKMLTTEDFIKKAKEIHGDTYDYSEVDYKGYDCYVKIKCPVHGIFEQTPDSHLQGKGCPKCSVRMSKSEDEICELLSSNGLEIKQGERNLIRPYEIDIYCDEKKIGIEYDGIRWHSEKYKCDKNYHLMKTDMCKEKGVKLIHIFEDEYETKKDIVNNKLKHLFGIDTKKPRIYGRKCTVKEITIKESREFLDKYHIQGFSSSTVYIGAFYNNKLIGVMLFKAILKDSGEWELNRFATDYNYICCGVGGKMFSFFVKKYKPEFIKSFADRRWTIDEENNIYTKMGFSFDSYTRPDYKYVINNVFKRFHKFAFRKWVLSKKYGFPMSMTEDEMTKKLDASKIWDCGLIRYIWRNKK